MFFTQTRPIFNIKYFECMLQKKCASTKFYYAMPDKYRNSFFLANASFFDNTNWYIHHAYELIFSDLVEEFKKHEPTYSNSNAAERISNAIYCMDLCNELLDINFPIKRNNNKTEILRGYRAHHGLHFLRKPCLGGLRLSTSLHKDHCKALAVLSTYRNLSIGINLGGAHGGIKISPKTCDENELRDIVQAYAKELAEHNFCGSNIDIIEPDMYTGPLEMSWIVHALTENTGELNSACAVGKSPTYGGVANYEQIIAESVFFIADYFLKYEKFMSKIDLPCGWNEKTFVIQGLGKAGKSIATYIEKAGATCVGVKEQDAYIYDKNGISVKEIIKYKNETGSIIGFNDKVKPTDVYDVFKENFDILILAANYKSLVCYLADKMKAKILIEVANGAITPSADKILLGRNKLILPDILINTGSSIASYFEYMENIRNEPFQNIIKRCTSEMLQISTHPLENSIQVIFDKIQTSSKENITFNILKYLLLHYIKEILNCTEHYHLGVDLRTATYINSINKLFKIIFHCKK